MKTKILKTITKLTLLVAWFSFFIACANVKAPTGGPKDKTPPKLIDTLCYPNPSFNTNRDGSSIFLVFNETTEVSNLKGQITSTPIIDTKPIKYKTASIKVRDSSGKRLKGTSVSIDLNQKLDSNTTYSINFGEAFKDINEGKVASNISVAFSTGPIIDSLSIAGKVTVNNTGKPAKDVLVGLYPINDTSNAINTLPKYYTNTDKKGKFIIDYLKPGTYRLAAFTDKNRNKTYNIKSEKIAFLPDDIKLDSNLSKTNLILFTEDDREPALNRKTIYKSLAVLEFNKGLEKVEIQNYDEQYLKFSPNRKKLSIYQNLVKDTLISVKMTDSSGLSTDSIISLHFNSTKKLKQKKLLTSEYQYINNNFKEIISFSQPIFETNLDSSSLYAKNKSYNFDSIVKMEWTNNKTELTISGKLPHYHDTLHLDFKKGSFITITNDTIHLKKKLIRTESGQFGSLFFTVKSKQPHYVIEVFNKKGKLIKTERNTNNIELLNLKPQTISIRVLIDENNNGKYDNGDYLNNKLPEKYIYIKEKYKVRAGWDLSDLEIKIK